MTSWGHRGSEAQVQAGVMCHSLFRYIITRFVQTIIVTSVAVALDVDAPRRLFSVLNILRTFFCPQQDGVGPSEPVVEGEAAAPNQGTHFYSAFPPTLHP